MTKEEIAKELCGRAGFEMAIKFMNGQGSIKEFFLDVAYNSNDSLALIKEAIEIRMRNLCLLEATAE